VSSASFNRFLANSAGGTMDRLLAVIIGVVMIPDV